MSKIKGNNNYDGNYQVLELMDYLSDQKYELRKFEYERMKCNNSKATKKEIKEKNENTKKLKSNEYEEFIIYKEALEKLFKTSIKKSPIKKMKAYKKLATDFRRFYLKKNDINGDTDD